MDGAVQPEVDMGVWGEGGGTMVWSSQGWGGGGLGVQQVHNSIALCAPGVAMDPMWCHCV